MVQGVGYRFFAHRAALRLDLAGYVKNLLDGRVEVYAIGPPGVLRTLRAELERGPRGASVAEVSEMEAPVDTRFAEGFSIEHDA
ncbi:MAG: acylphosphatase [Acidobacteriia bacterium]|nr:acylphosphatase [Terriglobia bacterium]